MDRRLLFPAVAMTALAQQTSPASVEAEKAVRARAEQFYQFEVSKDRHAESMVAEESKDYFYNSGKPNMKAFSIKSVELTDENTRAIIHLSVKVELMAPGVGAQVFEGVAQSNWKIENGQWYWYLDKSAALMTPFGKMIPGPAVPGSTGMDMTGRAPSPMGLESLVSLDRHSVVLTARDPDQSVMISNGLPGAITLALGGNRINGLTTEIEKSELKAGEKAAVHFRRAGDAKPAGTMVITVSPLNIELAVDVKSE
jgi:hypothetical protein